MKAKLFKRNGCPHCDNVVEPNEGVEVIYVDNPDYEAKGFVPNDVPLLQFGTVVLVGATHINDYFESAKLIK